MRRYHFGQLCELRAYASTSALNCTVILTRICHGVASSVSSSVADVAATLLRRTAAPAAMASVSLGILLASSAAVSVAWGSGCGCVATCYAAMLYGAQPSAWNAAMMASASTLTVDGPATT